MVRAGQTVREFCGGQGRVWAIGFGFNSATFCDTAVIPSRKAVMQMITEIAQIDVKPGSEKDFEAAIAKAEPIFRRCKGWKSFELHRGIEKPSRYRLHIKWETLENHTEDFRGSENFAQWRALVGPHFAAPPEVEHTNTVASF
jgi:heme-degrading monooxygenase HmoA